MALREASIPSYCTSLWRRSLPVRTWPFVGKLRYQILCHETNFILSCLRSEASQANLQRPR